MLMLTRLVLTRIAAIGCGLVVLTATTLAQNATSPPAPGPGAAAPAQAAPAPAKPAQTAPPETSPLPTGSDQARYSFSRVDDGYLRLDIHTGQVSLCSRREVGWACQVLPDDRIVLDNAIARLESENGRLKQALLSRGLPLPSGIAPPKHEQPKAEAAEPSNLDRVVTTMSAMWQRLVDMIGSLTGKLRNGS